MRTSSHRFSIVAALLTLAAAGPIVAAEPLTLALSGGIFDFEESELSEAGIELRGRTATERAWGLGWIAGVAANEEDGLWAHAGARRPFRLGGAVLLTPSFAFTYYDRGDGKDLGQELEFRSGIELAGRFANGATLGVSFYHLSNAGLSELNPGENSLVLVVGIPLGR